MGVDYQKHNPSCYRVRSHAFRLALTCFLIIFLAIQTDRYHVPRILFSFQHVSKFLIDISYFDYATLQAILRSRDIDVQTIFVYVIPYIS